MKHYVNINPNSKAVNDTGFSNNAGRNSNRFINKDGRQDSLPLLSKYEVAEQLIQKIVPWLI